MSRTGTAGGLGRRLATAVAFVVTAAALAPPAALATSVERPPGSAGGLLLWLLPPVVSAAAWRATRRRGPADDGRPAPAPRRGTWRDALSLAASSQDE